MKMLLMVKLRKKYTMDVIQKLWRKKCAELEYTNFGGYGGVPLEEEEGEEE